MCDLWKRLQSQRDSQRPWARVASLFFLWLPVGALAGSPPGSAGPEPPSRKNVPSLESCLTPLIIAHKGKVAVAVKHLVTGESFEYHADEVMPTASLIKFPVMIEAYRQAAAKQIDLDAVIVLKKSDKVPGSGVLT